MSNNDATFTKRNKKLQFSVSFFCEIFSKNDWNFCHHLMLQLLVPSLLWGKNPIIVKRNFWKKKTHETFTKTWTQYFLLKTNEEEICKLKYNGNLLQFWCVNLEFSHIRIEGNFALLTLIYFSLIDFQYRTLCKNLCNNQRLLIKSSKKMTNLGIDAINENFMKNWNFIKKNHYESYVTDDYTPS